MNLETCPDCGCTDWKWIPDSLAQYCQCGFVRVMNGKDKWEPGATLQQWWADTYGAKTE